VYSVDEVLHSTSRATFYRGHRKGDGAAVVIKALAPHHGPQQLARLRNEYAILKSLDGPATVRPLALDNYQGAPALVVEDFGGVSLSRDNHGPLSVAAFLPLATKIAAAAADVHAHNVVHKDLRPDNIFVAPATGEVKLAEFDVATTLPCEQPTQGSARLLEASLPYMSPEQTGRTNRAPDERSDLYSLGVTFYEMLTGHLPFAASDPLEWVDCHVARTPEAPASAVPGLPAMLSAIVMRLLAKEPEARYQTARGLQHDLEQCGKAWRAEGHIPAFPLGAHDVRDRLRLPQRLYGREREVGTLLDAFSRVVATGTPEVVLVAGAAGVGKSSLVQELRKPVVHGRGFFAAGKFEQYKRDIPYSTIVDAFTELVFEILARGEEEVAAWRERLQSALGKNGQLVVDVIAPVELVIGPQPPVPALPPNEAQNRFRLVFRQFVAVFASPAHPLALFLDDLQWADPASLTFLQDLVAQPQIHHLFLVGAYRDNEVGPTHRVAAFARALDTNDTQVVRLTLAPLSLEKLHTFVADALHDGDDVASLAELVEEKTGGNPFFAIQFLNLLSEERLVEFDRASGRFRWDMARIHAHGLTDDIFELMNARLRRLAPACQAALGRLACLGGNVDVKLLALGTGQTATEAIGELREAMQAGLVLRVGASLRFLHDRVHEAAYTLIPDTKKPELHLALGRRLLTRLPPAALDERIFEVVNQLNRGLPLLAAPEERAEVRGLNVQAGRKAKAAVAFGSASIHFAEAAALLPADSWVTRYEETFAINLERAECEYLIGNFGRADDLFRLLLDRADSNLEAARAYSIRMRLLQVSGRYRQALDVAFEALRLFDVRCPQTDAELESAFLAENREIPGNLRGRAIADLADAPPVRDPAVKAIMGLLVDATPCAFIGRPQAFPLLVVKALNLSLHFGNTAEAAYAYCAYSIMLVARFGDIPTAFEYSRMALRLHANLGDAKLKGTLLFLHAAFVNCWRRQISTTRVLLEEALAASLEVGDWMYACYNIGQAAWYPVETGESLDEVARQCARYADLAVECHHDMVHLTIRQYAQFVAAMKGRTRAPDSLDDAGFDEAATLAAFSAAGFRSGLFLQHMEKQVLSFFFGRYEESLAAAGRAALEVGAMMGTYMEATHVKYEALALAARLRQIAPALRSELALRLDERLAEIRAWADHAPENHVADILLIEAERARSEGGDRESTRRLYEAAVKAADEARFPHKAALAHELAAEFCAERGLHEDAELHRREARIGYAHWGADAKVNLLRP
jgi:predicted ATPase